MKITELKKQLTAMDKADLVALLCRLYKANRQCQAILDVKMCGAPAEAPIIESCRKKIHAAFFGRQLSLKNARAVCAHLPAGVIAHLNTVRQLTHDLYRVLHVFALTLLRCAAVLAEYTHIAAYALRFTSSRFALVHARQRFCNLRCPRAVVHKLTC